MPPVINSVVRISQLGVNPAPGPKLRTEFPATFGATVPRSGTTYRVDYENLLYKTVAVEAFGAIGDGNSHPAGDYFGVSTLADLQAIEGGLYWFADSLTNEVDYLAIQAAFYSGDYVVGRPGASYYVQKTLIFENGKSQANFYNCQLLFNLLTPQTSSLNLITNGTFADGTGWVNAPFPDETDWVFGGGYATWTDPGYPPPPGESNTFGEFGQQVPVIPKGKWRASFDVIVTEGASHGIGGLPYIYGGFWEDAPGVGPSVITNNVRLDGKRDGVQHLYFDFEIFSDVVNNWFAIGCGNANYQVTNVKISPYFLNCAIWCMGDYNGAENYDASALLGGVITGPSRSANGITGILHKNFTGNGNRCEFGSNKIWRFETGFDLGSQAYLNVWQNVKIGETITCFKFSAGSVNAGENLRFYGCIFYNSLLGINAESACELNFFGCSFDFTRQIVIASAATIGFHGCHFETTLNGYDPPQTSAQYPFILSNGTQLLFFGGEILFSGFSTSVPNYIIGTSDVNDKFVSYGLWCYNWQTPTGIAMTGPGMFQAKDFLPGPGNSLMPKMISRNFSNDTAGENGTFEPLNMISAGGPPDDIGIIGGLWNYGQGVSTGRYSGTVLSAQRSNTAAHTGNWSLSFSKNGTGGGGDLQFFFPCTEGAVGFCEMYAKQIAVSPNTAWGPYTLTNQFSMNAGESILYVNNGSLPLGCGTGWQVTLASSVTIGGVTVPAGTYNCIKSGTNAGIQVGVTAVSSQLFAGGTHDVSYLQTSWLLYFRHAWAEIIGWDSLSRPMVGRSLFTGEMNLWIPNNGALPDWTYFTGSTWYSFGGAPVNDLLEYGNGRAPAWATHWLITIGNSNAPDTYEFFIDDLRVNLPG